MELTLQYIIYHLLNTSESGLRHKITEAVCVGGNPDACIQCSLCGW